MGDDARGATGLLSRSERAGHSDARSYVFASPNNVAEALNERAAAQRIASHVPVDRSSRS